MKLFEWLAREKISKRHLAAQIGVHENHIYKIVKGDFFPSYQVAKRIQEYTNGEVTVDELIRKKASFPRCPHCGQFIPQSKKQLGLKEKK